MFTNVWFCSPYRHVEDGTSQCPCTWEESGAVFFFFLVKCEVGQWTEEVKNPCLILHHSLQQWSWRRPCHLDGKNKDWSPLLLSPCLRGQLFSKRSTWSSLAMAWRRNNFLSSHWDVGVVCSHNLVLSLLKDSELGKEQTRRAKPKKICFGSVLHFHNFRTNETPACLLWKWKESVERKGLTMRKQCPKESRYTAMHKLRGGSLSSWGTSKL